MQPGPKDSTIRRYQLPFRKEGKDSEELASYALKIGIRMSSGEVFSERVKINDSHALATKEQQEVARELASKNNRRYVPTSEINGMTLSSPIIWMIPNLTPFVRTRGIRPDDMAISTAELIRAYRSCVEMK